MTLFNRESGFHLVLVVWLVCLIGMLVNPLTVIFSGGGASANEGRPTGGEGGNTTAPSDARAAGEEIYGRCLACHSVEYDRVGPRHCGLFGRAAGSVPGFSYSAAMRDSGIIWSRETLDQFLNNPMEVVPGTLMTYAGVPDASDRAKLIAWLEFATAQDRCRPRNSF